LILTRDADLTDAVPDRIGPHTALATTTPVTLSRLDITCLASLLSWVFRNGGGGIHGAARPWPRSKS